MKNSNTKLMGLLLMCQLLTVSFQISKAADADTLAPSIPSTSTSAASPAPAAQTTDPSTLTTTTSPTDASMASTQPITTTPPPPPTTTTTTITLTPAATPAPTTTAPPPPTTTAPTTAPPATTPPPSPPATTTEAPQATTTTEATTTASATTAPQTQPAPTSTLAPTATQTMAPATTASPAQETSTGTAATPSTTSQPDGQSSSPSASAATSAVPNPTGSESMTTAGPSSTVPAEPTTTAVPSTTTTAKSAYPTKQPEKPFEVVLVVGDAKDSAVYCDDINCTFGDIAPQHWPCACGSSSFFSALYVETPRVWDFPCIRELTGNSKLCPALCVQMREAFVTVPGYLYLREGTRAANRRKRDTRFSVDVLFDFQKLTSLTTEARTQALYTALQNLNDKSKVGVNLTQANATAVAAFAAADMCTIPEVCPGGYSCERGACHHLCEKHDCGNHGVCNTVVNADGSSSAQCVCNSDDEHTYSGDRCQEEETSKAKVASIVGGVLGALCALLLIIIVFMAYRLCNKGGGSKGKYQLGGYSNNGYADHEFAMKNVADDNP